MLLLPGLHMELPWDPTMVDFFLCNFPFGSIKRSTELLDNTIKMGLLHVKPSAVNVNLSALWVKLLCVLNKFLA